jgi:hypothetical protein
MRNAALGLVGLLFCGVAFVNMLRAGDWLLATIVGAFAVVPLGGV